MGDAPETLRERFGVPHTSNQPHVEQKRHREAHRGLLADPPIARRGDAETSHSAAHRQNASGRRGKQQRIVLDLVKRMPGLCSKEYATHCDLDRYQVARVLPQLAHADLVIRGDKMTPPKPARIYENGSHESWWPL